MDLEIREFREGLIKYINGVNLPMEIKRLVVKEVYGEIDNCANDVINAQIQAQRKQEQKEGDEDAESV